MSKTSGGGSGAAGGARAGRQREIGGGGEISSPSSLPALEGSEKQIAWANQIRDKKLPEIKQYIEKKTKGYAEYRKKEMDGNQSAKIKEHTESGQKILNAVSQVKKASHWIDINKQSPSSAYKELLSRNYKVGSVGESLFNVSMVPSNYLN